MHPSCSNQFWIPGWWLNTAFKVVANIANQNGFLPKDGTTVQNVSWRQVGAGVVFRMADGTLERLRDLNLRAQTGRYALFEHYWSTGQCQPKFLGIGAEV